MTLSNKLIALILAGMITVLGVTPVRAADASLLFTPSTINISGDGEIVASIILNTAGQGAAGAGVKINYDPYYLSAIRIERGDIFTDYPATTIDNSQGKIVISGIASSPTDLFTGEGLFADIVFRPYHAGASKVEFSFTPGDTTDSNIAVMTGNGDILSVVNELTVNASETSETIPDISPSPIAVLSFLDSQSSTVKKIAKALGLSKVVDQYTLGREEGDGITDSSVDPLAPIVRQDPITDPSTSQPVAKTAGVAKSSSNSVVIVLIILVLILLGVIAWFIMLRRQSPPPIPQTPTYPPVMPPVQSPTL